MPKISVQICCYNSEKYLDATIRSILAQSFKDWELVIVNDGSTDSTEKIIKGYMNADSPITYLYQENKGFAYARNKAIEHSSGEWIAILDHDDLWVPDKLSIQNESLKKHPEAKIHFSNSEWFRDSGEIIKKNVKEDRFATGLIPDAFSKLVTEGCFIDSETVLINKKALVECGGFNEKYSYIVDYDIFVKIAGRYDHLYYENKVLAKWRVHSLQASQSMKEVMFKEYADLFEGISAAYVLPRRVGSAVRNTILSNRLKYAFLQLRRGRVGVFFTTFFKEIKAGALFPYVFSKIWKTFCRPFARFKFTGSL